MKPKLKLVIFDFDGVIADSTFIKHHAFLKVASLYGTNLSENLDFALRNVLIGAERTQVVAWIKQNHLPELDEVEFLSKFKIELEEKKPLIKPTPGVKEFLNLLHDLNIEKIILSSAPSTFINDTLTTFAIVDSQFKKIYTSDHGKKDEIMEKIIRESDLKSENILFIGDMPSDFKVAMPLNIPFVKIVSFVGKSCKWPRLDIPEITNFSDASFLNIFHEL